MAITHNLSDAGDNLSGFDPVAGIADGTTVGKSWVMWKLFEGLSAQFTNFKKITNSAPTPVFLQGDVGANLQTEPALNRANTADKIRFYNTEDLGLLEATPSAIIYEWKITSVGVGCNLIDMKTMYHKSGDALLNPFSTESIFSTTSTNEAISLYVTTVVTTTTVMANYPKMIFWKSGNAYAMMSISKDTGLYKGYGMILTQSLAYQGYKHNVGAITHDGVNLQLSILFSPSGLQHFEGVGQVYQSSQNSQSQSTVDNLTSLSSMGKSPTGLFTFDGIQNVIGGNLRFGYVDTTKTKVVSDPIEGLLLCSSNAVGTAIGTIQTFNGKYYLMCPTIDDGKNSHKVLLELEAV